MKHEAQLPNAAPFDVHTSGLVPDCMEQQIVNIPRGTSTLLWSLLSYLFRLAMTEKLLQPICL